MTHPVHRRPEASHTTGSNELAPVEQHAELTPTQHAQLQALVDLAVATTSNRTDHQLPPVSAGREAQRLSAEPSVLIAIVMLALVTIVALVVMFALVLGA